MIRGIDASSVQGAIPFHLMPDEKFCILKAQQGNDGFDPWFERNMKAALAVGKEVIPYCFSYPLPHLDPKAQAALFVKQVYRFPEMIGRPIAIDLEWPEVVPSKPGKKGWKEWNCEPTQLSEWMAIHAEEVERLSGRAPPLYTYFWWWECIRKGAPAYGFPKGADVSWAARYPLWMAWYKKGWPKSGDKPTVPAPWTSAVLWQFDGNGGLVLPNGVDADFCVFDGTEEELQSFMRPKSKNDLPIVDWDIVHPTIDFPDREFDWKTWDT